MTRRLVVALVALVAAGSLAGSLAACSTTTAPSVGGQIAVVTTSTVFADLVHEVGGDLVDVISLVPRNGDVHTFEPRPATVRAVAGARLLVMNGLGLDDWLAKTIANASAEGTPVLRLGDAVPSTELIDGDALAGGPANPHLWLSASLATLYVTAIGRALGEIDPGHGAVYIANATVYNERLLTFDGATRARFTAIPVARRRIVTFHDALPYFAREYGLVIVGVAVGSPGQDPSAAQISALVAAIRDAGVTAIFSEQQFPTRLVDQIAAETGATVESSLYSDSVGDPPQDSYLAIMQWNVDRIAGALGG